MKGNRRLPIAASLAVLGVLGLWFLLGTARPSHQKASAPRRQTLSGTAITMDGPAATREGALSGHVRGRDGKAVGNARVCATTVRSEVSWTPRPTCATTDGQGSYRVAPLESTAYAVSAVARGFRPASALLGRSIFLGQGEAKTGVDIVLDAGGAQLNGQVLDATGGPISGAMIRVLRRATPHDTTITESGPDGSFSVWMAAGPVTVIAEAPEYAPVRIAHIVPSRDLVLKLTPGSVVSGRVIAAGTGAPVEGVQVRAIRPGTWNDPTRPSATSQADGAFEVRGLEAGMYTLVGERVGWRGESHTPVEVALAGQVDGLTLTVSTATVVTGKVVRRDTAEPCSRGRVVLGPPDRGAAPGNGAPHMGPSAPTIATNLEADGTARFAAVPAGSYQVNVQCEESRLVEGPTTLAVGGNDIEGLLWKVDPGVRLVVRAVDQLGQPVANTFLFLQEGPPKDAAAKDGARPRRPVRGFTTTADGTFELTGLAPGIYTVEPSSPDGTKPVMVDARGSDKLEVTIRLEGQGRMLVTVRSPEGVGVDQVEVTATRSRGDTTSQASNAKGVAPGTISPGAPSSGEIFRGTGIGDGRFEIGPLVSGAYHVAVSDGINPPSEPNDWPRGIVAVREGVARATVVLRRGGSLSGRVVDSSRQAVPDLWVTADCTAMAGDSRQRGFSQIASRPGSSSRAVSDQEGRFHIDRIAADAQCVLRAEQPGSGSMGVVKGVHPGEETVITIRGAGSLSGTAILPDGSPATRFQLLVRNPEGPTRTEILTATNGRWSLSRVVPGRIHLSAFDASHDAAEASVELAPGEQRDGVALQFQQPPKGEPKDLRAPQP